MKLPSLVRPVGVAVLTAALALGACSSDKKTADTSAPPGTEAATGGATTGDTAAPDTAVDTATDTGAVDTGDTEATPADIHYADWCEASAGVNEYFNMQPEVDFETASEEEIAAALKKYAKGAQPYIEAATPLIPEEIKADIQTQIDGINKIAETGDPSVLDDPAFKAADQKGHAYDVANCDWQQVPVSATDYAFAGIPPTLETGVTSFNFRNDGKELHQLLVLRKKDGVTESWDDIIKLPQEEAQAKVDVVMEVDGAPAAEDYGVVDLKSGDYLAVCFVPQGTTDQNSQPAPDAKSHAELGMHTEFKVA